MPDPIILRERDALSVHPLLLAVPRLAHDAPEMLALIASVELHGILSPLLSNDRGEIIDGRARLYAAEKAGLKEVPCLVRLDEDAPSIILDTLCGRRHLTKSALAYVAFPLMEASAQASSNRRVANLMTGKKSRLLPKTTIGKTVEQHAAELGFERTLFYRAREVCHLFGQQPAFRVQMEPLLLSGEVSLQGVVAAWTGIQNKGCERGHGDQLDLFGKCFDALRYHFRRTWGSMDEAKRAALVPQVRDTVAEMPPEVRAAFAAEIKAADKAAKEAGQTV